MRVDQASVEVGAEGGIISEGAAQVIDDLGNPRPERENRGEAVRPYLFLFASPTALLSPTLTPAIATPFAWLISAARFEGVGGQAGSSNVNVSRANDPWNKKSGLIRRAKAPTGDT